MVQDGSSHNGWISMALTKGLDKTNQNLADNLNTVSIVSGLLITISFASLVIEHRFRQSG